MTDPAKTATEHQTRLNEIRTRWSLLNLAHHDSVTTAGPAREALVLRYSGAIRKYIGAILYEEHAADDVAQEVLVRLLKGDFARATPERGRFRDYLAVAARNLARSYWAKSGHRAGQGLDVDQFPAAEPGDLPSDTEMITTWRKAILDMTWNALENYQRTHKGSVSYTLLRLRTDHPDDDSEQLAARLSEAVGKRFRAAAMRQQLRRARLRFAEFLIEEIARSMDDPTPERVEEELIVIGLMEYVRDFLPADWRTRGELE